MLKWRERWLRSLEEEPEEMLTLDGYRAKLFWMKLLDSMNTYHDKKYRKTKANYSKRYGSEK